MQDNKDASTEFDKGAYTIFCHKEMKTGFDISNENKEKLVADKCEKKVAWYAKSIPVIYNYVTLGILGLFLWGTLWSTWGDEWSWGGQWFRLAVVAIVAWATGLVLNTLTMMPHMVAYLVTGIIAKNIGYLDMTENAELDLFLRKIYPVLILGKGALAWDLKYMKDNWIRVANLGTLPWLGEMVVAILCAHYILGFPIIWVLLFSTMYSSLSIAMVMPPVIRFTKTMAPKRNWAKLVYAAGAVDTTLSVAGAGMFFTYIFYPTDDVYRYSKACLTLFAGIALGVALGSVAGLVPHSKDMYVTELRIGVVLIGGFLSNTFTARVGWIGVGGVAILVCNATAATFWARDGWPLNNNPASTFYRVIWTILEPMLFAYTGTFFTIDSTSVKVLIPGFGILALCVFARLFVASLVCWDFEFKEKLFIFCTWIPKTIVEGVMSPLAYCTLAAQGLGDSTEGQYAASIVTLMIQAILITTPLGFLLTNHLGPILLKNLQKDCEHKEPSPQKIKPTDRSQSEV